MLVQVPSRVLSRFVVRYVQVVAIGLNDQGSLSGCRAVYKPVVCCSLSSIMASMFSRSKSASKGKDQKGKDLRKEHGKEKETQFMEQGATKKTGQGKHAKETVSIGGQEGIELSSGLEASAGDHKKKEKKESRRFSLGKPKGSKKKPPDQAATSPSKKPSASTPSSPGDPTVRTSAELYQSPEKQHDQQKLAEAVRHR